MFVRGPADLRHFIENQTKFDEESGIHAVKTVFGWALHGPCTSTLATSLMTSAVERSEEAVLKQMYSLEQVPSVSTQTAEEKSAVQQFQKSIRRHTDGRYSCKLPRVENPPVLGMLTVQREFTHSLAIVVPTGGTSLTGLMTRIR